MSPNGINGVAVNGESQNRVIIVGAGPVGLFAALKLGQAGIQVDVVEQMKAPSDALRAAGFHGPLLEAMKKAGVYDKMEPFGYVTGGLCWRYPPVDDGKQGKMLGEIVARLPTYQTPTEAGVKPKGGLLILPQGKFVERMVPEVLDTGNVNLHFDSELIAITEADNHVTVTVKSAISGDTRELSGNFLVGADGGKSVTRKLLGIDFPGHTWPERMLVTEVEVLNGNVAEIPTGFQMDPTHFAAHIPLAEPVEGELSLWRYAMGIVPANERPDEELLSDAFVAEMFERIMPGPRPLQYDVKRRAMYRIHQRCATTMRRGRCLLAGDAAHLNNPFGAMGLATGLLDAEAVGDALRLVINEKLPDAVLDLYSDERRRVFQFLVDPTTTQNKIRVASDPKFAAKEDGFLRMLNAGRPEVMEAYRKQLFETWRTDMEKKAAERGMVPQGS